MSKLKFIMPIFPSQKAKQRMIFCCRNQSFEDWIDFCARMSRFFSKILNPGEKFLRGRKRSGKSLIKFKTRNFTRDFNWTIQTWGKWEINSWRNHNIDLRFFLSFQFEIKAWKGGFETFSFQNLEKYVTRIFCRKFFWILKEMKWEKNRHNFKGKEKLF